MSEQENWVKCAMCGVTTESTSFFYYEAEDKKYPICYSHALDFKAELRWSREGINVTHQYDEAVMMKLLHFEEKLQSVQTILGDVQSYVNEFAKFKGKLKQMEKEKMKLEEQINDARKHENVMRNNMLEATINLGIAKGENSIFKTKIEELEGKLK